MTWTVPGAGHTAVQIPKRPASCAFAARTTYSMQVTGYFFELLMWLDEIQVATASFSRILGVGEVEPDRAPGGPAPVRSRGSSPTT